MCGGLAARSCAGAGWGGAVADELPELFKKICPFGGARDEDVALVAIVALSAQIAEGTQSVQGARDDRLRYVQRAGQAAHRMWPRFEIYEQKKRHLPIGQIGFARTDVVHQSGHPGR